MERLGLGSFAFCVCSLQVVGVSVLRVKYVYNGMHVDMLKYVLCFTYKSPQRMRKSLILFYVIVC